MWDQGFVPFVETIRRHERWFEENAAEQKAFVNYNRYLWARYGSYNRNVLHLPHGWRRYRV